MPGSTVKQKAVKAKATKAKSVKAKVVESTSALKTLNQPSLPSPGGSLPAPLAIVQKWESLSSEKTADGTQVKTYLGFALQLVTFAGGTGTAVYFERGMIVHRPDGQTFVVYGMIYLHYRELGDVVPTGW